VSGELASSNASELAMTDLRTMDDPAGADRLARMYLVLSRTHAAIDRADTQANLLEAACRTIVEVGLFRMCWVGTVDAGYGRVVPAASAGHDEGYLDFVQIRLEGARSEGPTGQAIRLRSTVRCDDVATDPRMGPWREEALRRGYRSSVGLPLLCRDELFGVLTVYADQPNRFDAAEVELLEELAGDVSLAISSLSETAGRHRAEEALIESESRFRAVAETLIDPLTIVRAERDESGRIVDFVYEFINQAAIRAHGLSSADELVGRSLRDSLGREPLFDMYVRAVEADEPIVLDDFPYSRAGADGAPERFYDIRASKVADGLVFIWRDVTERRAAERRRAVELEELVGRRTADLAATQRRATELARLGTALVGVTSDVQVADLLLDSARTAAGAIDGVVARVLPGAEREISLGSFGLDEDSMRQVLETAGSFRTPIRDAASTGLPIVIEGAAEFRSRYPALGNLQEEARSRGRVAVPLRTADKVIGAASFGFEPRPFVPFLAALANLAAIALERIRLGGAEREARDMLATVVAQMPVGVMIVDKDDLLLYANEAFTRILAGSAGSPAGVGMPAGANLDLVREAFDIRRADGEPYPYDERPVTRSLRTGEVLVDEEAMVVRPDGSSTTFTQTSSPILDANGKIVAAVAVTTDISAAKAAEQMREAFLAMLSHELRTPVTTIYAAAHFLATKGDRLDPAMKTGLVDDIAAEADRLDRMVDDLLVLARAERGMNIEVRTAALVQHTLRSVAKAVSAAWPERKFRLEIPDGVPPVTGDDDYFEHVLRNLLVNAAKYGRTEVIARLVVERDSVAITVLDDGPGVPAADRERVFEPFIRLKGTNRLPGAGIGLFAVRTLVEAMGGTVSVADRPEGGASFTVRLPRFVDQAEQG
jgi:signal transduction histidine kinase/GAF domain-containing protein